MNISTVSSDDDYIDLSNFNSLEDCVSRFGLRAFRFKKKFTDNSSQGSVGILVKAPEDSRIDLEFPEISSELVYARDFFVSPYFAKQKIYPKDVIVYKIGTETPYLSRHEYAVSKSLHKLSMFLPNFMRPLGFVKDVLADPKRRGSPFLRYSTNNKIFSDLALFEYIEAPTTLGILLDNESEDVGRKKEGGRKREEKGKFQIINSLINQLMLAILISQQKINFIHNDLHFDNVLVSRCLERTFILYIFNLPSSTPETLTYALVPTFGHFPVIIDYGFSFTDHLNNGPLYTGIHHNNKGYLNYTFDEFTDFKTMLVRLAHSKYNFNGNNSGDGDAFRRLVRKQIVERLPIDRQTGWDTTKEDSVSKKLLKYIKPFVVDFLKNRKVKWEITEKLEDCFFIRKDYELIDVIGSLIILPLQNKKYDTLPEHLSSFLTEWMKIERWVSTTSDKIFVFTSIVDQIRADLTILGDLRETDDEDAIVQKQLVEFQRTIFKLMDKIGNKIVLNNLDYRKLYSSIISLSECFEGFKYLESEKCLKRKRSEYQKMEPKSSFDMYRLIEPFLMEPFEIQKGDYFVVLDACYEKSYSFVVKNEKIVKTVNDLPVSQKAEFLFKNIVNS